MATLKKFDFDGVEQGSIEVPVERLLGQANPQMIKDVIVALMHNRRQWSANTKGRSDVVASGKKPRPQKGTGNARQGSLAATQYRGGGRPFGPRPKFDQRLKVNRRERQAVMRQLLGQLIEAGKAVVFTGEDITEPSTKRAVSWLSHSGCQKRTLILVEEPSLELKDGDETIVIGSLGGHPFPNLGLSIRNLKKVELKLISQINAYDLINAHSLVMSENVAAKIVEALTSEESEA